MKERKHPIKKNQLSLKPTKTKKLTMKSMIKNMKKLIQEIKTRHHLVNLSMQRNLLLIFCLRSCYLLLKKNEKRKNKKNLDLDRHRKVKSTTLELISHFIILALFFSLHRFIMLKTFA